jgi:hypothetical protein
VVVEVAAVDRHGLTHTLHRAETRPLPGGSSPRWGVAVDVPCPWLAAAAGPSRPAVEDGLLVVKAYDPRGIGRAFLGQVGQRSSPGLSSHAR